MVGMTRGTIPVVVPEEYSIRKKSTKRVILVIASDLVGPTGRWVGKAVVAGLRASLQPE